ncbi:family 43 glycosylhydrolase [Rufibacter sp. LB8]|uniref:glycoside hydrolase family 43 protein n=1 Tax=Rufibacter sp. LB8 TaxID=2777781 RepID=UPI00178C17CE|nr:glycoside hydrolase family 43 protein [Rufibacter sp. LB8]
MKKSALKVLVLGLCQAVLFGCAPRTIPSGTVTTTKPTAQATQFFTNPIADGADPWVIKQDGMYYSCGVTKGGIYVSKSPVLTKFGERVPVWKAPATGWNSSNLWAPEIHFLQGKWYIYYTAGRKEGGPFLYQRSGVLESVSDDPFGPYADKGMLHTGDHLQDTASIKWAIDLSPFSLNGQLYAVWSGWEENAATDKTKQHLYIARMQNPYTISSTRVKLSSPVADWETGGELDLQEGPEMLKKKEKAFIIYSTRESWLKEYRLGYLLLTDTLADPTQPQNWTKSAGPVFQGTAQVLGAGHCSFTTSPDGSEDWILYHSKKTVNPGWQRDIRMQKFTWSATGLPVFGEPVPAGVPLAVPSGQKNQE